ncbi:MAG: imidazole glycerol phosphate synthase subunit HisH [Verrucomicrobiota bacterium]
MKCGLINYGRGNLASVRKALVNSGTKVCDITAAEQFDSVEAVVFPGQGHFGESVTKLTDMGLVDPIKQWIEADKPFLGICLGFQLLFEESEESPGVDGLGILKGKVVRFPSNVGKIPHMGWNVVKAQDKQNSLFRELSATPYFFHVHSYYPEGVDADVVACFTEYGVKFVSGIRKGNIHAFQFHPEKSQANGIKLLDAFVAFVKSYGTQSRI